MNSLNRYSKITAQNALAFSNLLILVLFVFLTSGCKKNWLDAKPDKALVVPVKIEDYQALLDNTNIFNSGDCFFDEIGAGDFYVTDASWNSFTSISQRNLYSWSPDIFENDQANYTAWSNPYERIFYSNIILEGSDKIIPKTALQQKNLDNVKGAALFHRAFNYYQLARCFSKPYVKATASDDLGVPIRLQADIDINIPSIRASIQQTYDQIISDLKHSAELLPIKTPISNIYRVRPTQAAARAMLARVYLSMSDYDSALLFSNSTLQLYDSLMDYNNMAQVNLPMTNAFSFLNSEVLFDMAAANFTILTSTHLIVDSFLYRSYNNNDLRRTAFFRLVSGKNTIKGSYGGGSLRFTGLATDEIYLIRAECSARKGMIPEALADLNLLLKKRWANSAVFNPITATDANDAINKILVERRKELCYRGLRWSDLRRLNLVPSTATNLTKVLNGKTLTLPPNSSLYVLPIPPNVITLSGIKQNIR